MPRPRVFMLAIDGLDWQVLQEGVDAGQLPFFAQLLEGGRSGALAPAIGSSASAWTSAATGVWPDRHGVCHDLAVRADGLSLGPARQEIVQTETVWDVLAEAGHQAWAIGWPATVPDALARDAGPECSRGPARAVQGFEVAQGHDPAHWPMSPGVCHPPALRDSLEQSRIHPSDFLAEDLLALMPAGWPAHRIGDMQGMLARWSSLHDLGLRWAALPDWDLLAVRLDGLPEWIAGVSRNVPDVATRDALAMWLPWLDLVLGRYMGLLGREVCIMLIADRGLPLDAASFAVLEPGERPGGLALAGPGIAKDALLQGPTLVDVAPTVLGRFALPCPAHLDGRDLMAERAASLGKPQWLAWPGVRRPQGFAPERQDRASLNWLISQGLPPLDLNPLRAIAEIVEGESLIVWALCRLQRGHSSEAVAALNCALERLPDPHAPARLLLGQALLQAGRIDACRALLEGTPDELLPGLWPEACRGLIAYAGAHWTLAEQYFGQIAAVTVCGADAPVQGLNAAAWLGWCRLAQGDPAGALTWFEQAQHHRPLPARLHEGRARALLALGDATAAHQALDEAMALRPYEAMLHLLRRLAYARQGKDALASAAHWRAFELDPALTSTGTNLLEAFGPRPSSNARVGL